MKIRFYPILRSASMIEIHFSWYVENVKLFLSQKSQFDLAEKIKNKNKKRTRASLFQCSEDGKQEKKFMWPYNKILPLNAGILYRLILHKFHWIYWKVIKDNVFSKHLIRCTRVKSTKVIFHHNANTILQNMYVYKNTNLVCYMDD